MKENFKATIVVLVLTLLVWAFFYVKNMPLNLIETAVVSGFFAAAVYLGKAVWSRFEREEKTDAQKP